MFIIERVQVNGFRGSDKPIAFQLDPAVNFLIGRNGTGKTTLINLMNAALAVDVVTLNRLPFTRIEVHLRQSGSRQRPSITIEKSSSNTESEITYSIKTGSKKPPLKMNVNLSPETLARYGVSFRESFRRIYSERIMSASKPVLEKVNELVYVNWLSVSRGDQSFRDTEDKNELPIDKRLSQVSINFGIYFSTLDKPAAEATDSFQKTYFLSLLFSASRVKEVSSVKAMNLQGEKGALEGIFNEFQMKPSSYAARLNNHFKLAEKASESYQPSKQVKADDFLVLAETTRIHEIVQDWHTLLAKRREIYKPKNQFLSTIESLFFNKTLSINNGNEPVFSDNRGQEIPALELSSGEKQLFIILGEVLLQQGKPCIFLADEPELSLHVDWQVNLVPSLRKINPRAQIIFATHSPDIVGEFQNRQSTLKVCTSDVRADSCWAAQPTPFHEGRCNDLCRRRTR